MAEESSDMALLHSGVGGGGEDGTVGYSVLGFDPLYRLNVDAEARAALVWAPGMPQFVASGGPLSALQAAIDAVALETPHPLIGWLGFLSYDIGGTLEEIPRHSRDELGWPLLAFALYRHYLLFDRSVGTVQAFTLAADSRPVGKEEDFPWDRVRREGVAAAPASGGGTLVEFQVAEEYTARIRRVQEYIGAGDIYQANLAQRWTVQTPDRPIDIFRRLCAISPAPYSAFLRISDSNGKKRHVLSSSPELFIALDSGHAVTRPIKGTRPRDLTDPVHDTVLREELLASTKDRAELAMIVDLLRNDLGRVSKYGSIRVTEPRGLEQHPTVWHTVATIEADIRPGTTVTEVLAALCPGGSITGAPKIRAMQIIEELEGFRRALYCGNIGVIGPRSPEGQGASSMALNIAIRTILMQDDRAYLYAGGGIVSDSSHDMEYQETLHKVAAMFRACGVGIQ